MFHFAFGHAVIGLTPFARQAAAYLPITPVFRAREHLKEESIDRERGPYPLAAALVQAAEPSPALFAEVLLGSRRPSPARGTARGPKEIESRAYMAAKEIHSSLLGGAKLPGLGSMGKPPFRREPPFDGRRHDRVGPRVPWAGPPNQGNRCPSCPIWK